MASLNPPFDLLSLHSSRIVGQLSTMSETLESLLVHIEDVVAAYQALCLTAPRRHANNKSYFVGHTGYPSGDFNSNRREEHLASALWNTAQEESFTLPDQRSLNFLDYQFPLKATRHDKGVGKLDLFGLINDSIPCVIELKIHREDGQLGESPLRAYLEALAYSAIVQANLTDISKELDTNNAQDVANQTPIIIVLAPKKYWLRLIKNDHVASSWPALQKFADGIHKRLGVQAYFLAMSPSDFSMGSENQKPYLHERSSLTDVSVLAP